LLVVSERYPELKANNNFVTLQAQLEGTENRIAVERGRFNEVVQNYDASIQRFPAVLFAGMFGFTSKPYFAASTEAQNVPAVNFNFNATTHP
jgi:LemA protein